MFKITVLVLLVAAITAGGAIAYAQSARTVEVDTIASVEVRVWRNVVDPERLHLSTRPVGGRWTTHNTRLVMERAPSGNWDQSDFVTVDVPITVEVEVGEPASQAPASSVSSGGQAVERVTLTEGLRVCTFTVSGNSGDYGPTNIIVKLFNSEGSWELLVNEIEAEGTWERVLNLAGGEYLLEVDAAQPAMWTFSCQ